MSKKNEVLREAVKVLKERGLKNKEIAKELGVSAQRVSQILRDCKVAFIPCRVCKDTPGLMRNGLVCTCTTHFQRYPYRRIPQMCKRAHMRVGKKVHVAQPENLTIAINCYGYVYITRDTIENKIYVGRHKGEWDPNYKGSGTLITPILQQRWNTCTCKPLAIADDKASLKALESHFIATLDARNPAIGYNIKR